MTIEVDLDVKQNVDIYEGDPLKEVQRGQNWLEKINAARNYEGNYRKEALEAFSRYAGAAFSASSENPLSTLKAAFRNKRDIPHRNLFYSNIDVLKSLILPQMPLCRIVERKTKTEVQDLSERKFYRTVCRVLQSVMEYFCKNFSDEEYDDFKLDWLVAGRGVLWVSYLKASLRKTRSEDALLSTELPGSKGPNEEVRIERVAWNDFVMDPKSKWQDVKWVGRRVLLNFLEFKDNFPDVPTNKVTFSRYKDSFNSDFYEEGYEGDYETVDSFVGVWEVWDRNSGYTLFISDQYEGKLLKRIKLRTAEFFLPTPPPLMSIRNGIDMIPRSEYWLYKRELDELSAHAERSDLLVRSIQVKGYAEHTYTELVKELNSSSEHFVTTVRCNLPPDGSDPIHYIDNKPKEEVLAGLNEHAKNVKEAIYEITGLTEAMRAMAADRETAASIMKKNEYGTARLRKRQNDLNSYCMQVFKVMFLMIKEWFDIPTLQAISAMNLRSRKEVQGELFELQKAQSQMHTQIADLTPQDQQAPPGMPQPKQPQKPMGPMQGQQQQNQMMNQMQQMQQTQEMMMNQMQQGGPQQQQQQQPQQIQQQAPKQDQQQQWLIAATKEQQLNEKIMKLYAEVSWEDVIDFLRESKLSEFTFESNTEFNFLEDVPRQVQLRSAYLSTFVQSLQAAGPLMVQDPSVADMVTRLLDWVLEPLPSTAAMRGELEDYLMAISTRYKQMAVNPPPQPPNPEMMKAQAAVMSAQAKMQDVQVKGQKAQADMQLDMQKTQVDHTGENVRQQMVMAADAQRAREKMMSDQNLEQLKMQAKQSEYQAKMAADAQKAELDGFIKMQELQMKQKLEHQKLAAAERKAQLDMAKINMQMRQQSFKTNSDIQLKRQSANQDLVKHISGLNAAWSKSKQDAGLKREQMQHQTQLQREKSANENFNASQDRRHERAISQSKGV
jgi:hypothetical protein